MNVSCSLGPMSHAPHNTNLELQHDVAEIRPLDLWHRARQHLLLVRGLRVESVAFARARSTGPTRPLPRTCLCMFRYVINQYCDIIMLFYRYYSIVCLALACACSDM